VAALPIDELVIILRRERHLLRLLLFKFVEVHVLLGCRELRFLPWAAREADRARQQLREIDLVRAATVQHLGLRGMRAGTPTLREVAAVAVEPSAGLLRDHHEALCALVAEVELVGHACAEAAHAGIGELARADWRPRGRATLIDPPRAATPSRAAVISAEGFVDHELGVLGAESAYQAALEGTGRLRIPSLLAFLR
jgi:hypothetical protein